MSQVKLVYRGLRQVFPAGIGVDGVREVLPGDVVEFTSAADADELLRQGLWEAVAPAPAPSPRPAARKTGTDLGNTTSETSATGDAK